MQATKTWILPKTDAVAYTGLLLMLSILTITVVERIFHASFVIKNCPAGSGQKENLTLFLKMLL